MSVKVVFMDKRSELTSCHNAALKNECESYRIRISCNCPAPFNQRTGIIIIRGDSVIFKYIRCSRCRKGGQNDSQ